MTKELTVQQAELTLNSVNSLSNWTDPEQFKHMMQVATMLSKSEIVPVSYQGKPNDCLIAFDMASRINTNPLMVMQNLYVVNGKPSWSGQACDVLIKTCGKFSDVKHYRTGTKGQDDMGCYYTAIDKVTGELLTGIEVTIATAKANEWYGKKGSKWRTIPELMLVYRASAFFAREFCPEVLMGVHVQGEVGDMQASANRDLTELTVIPDEAEVKDAPLDLNKPNASRYKPNK